MQKYWRTQFCMPCQGWVDERKNFWLKKELPYFCSFYMLNLYRICKTFLSYKHIYLEIFCFEWTDEILCISFTLWCHLLKALIDIGESYAWQLKELFLCWLYNGIPPMRELSAQHSFEAIYKEHVFLILWFTLKTKITKLEDISLSPCTLIYGPNIQLPTFAFTRLLNKPHENEVTLAWQNLPLERW